MDTVHTILNFYRDPLFLKIPVVGSLVSMGSFVLFAAPYTWLAFRDPAWARKYRIQKRPAQTEKWMGQGIRSWLLNNFIMSVLVVLSWPMLRLSGIHDGPLPSPFVIVMQVLICIFLDDFIYYWMHRAMHRGWLYRYIHSIHHRVVTPSACAAHYMHPIEFVATGSLLLVGPVLLGVHVATLWIWIAVRQWESADAHCGYALPLNPMRLLPVYPGPAYHDFHHSKFVGNYASALGYLDGIFGAYATGYREWRRQSKSREDAEGRI